MARVTEFQEVVKGRLGNHTSTKARYSVHRDGGETYLQIETIGSSARREKGTVSQSLLLDSKAMAALRSILDKTIPAR
jgi:hypothetical protein